jgi:glycosyltransferase involved in cell wall biosynthesis
MVNPIGAIAAVLLGKPHVWWIREFGDLDHGFQLPYSPHETGSVIQKLSNYVITNSTGVQSHFFGSPSNRRLVFPSIPEVLKPLPSVNSSQHFWHFGVVGSIGSGKGQVDALGALFLLRKTGLDARLRFIGQGSDLDFERLKNVSAFLDVQDYVDFQSPHPLRENAYSELNAVVVTSRNEAFGRVAFEAIDCGIPVIATNTCGFLEVLGPDCKVPTYSSGKPSELAEILLEILRNPEFSRKVQESCISSISEQRNNFDLDAKVHTLLKASAVEGPLLRTSDLDSILEMLVPPGNEQKFIS